MTTSSGAGPTTRRFGPWRRWAGAAQAALFLGLPFVTVRGESALRFDVPTLRLHVLGATLWMDEFFVLLLALLAVTFLFLLVTFVWGRVWCGWSCPQTILGDLTGMLAAERARKRPRPGRLALGWGAVALVSAAFSAATLWYFVPPLEFGRRLLGGDLGPVLSGSWAVLFAVLFLDLALVRGRFCATTCPYAKLQGVLFDRATLVVAYDDRRDAECIDCGACVRVCPTGIDIRDGLQAECIACAQCVDACAPIMAKRGAPTLVDYFFGAPGERPRRLRPVVLGLGAAALLATAGTVVAAVQASRESLDLSVAPSVGFTPRLSPEGRVVAAYDVSVENRGRAPVSLRLSLAPATGEATLSPDRMDLAPGEHRKVRVVASAAGLGPGPVVDAVLSARAAGGDTVHARVPMFLPRAR
ncbi:MAG TPA: 4Fe-4S dicluster domain-containing protein [Anaeromyxobacteraceae bacterium]|nr:4Fe-4S dicluster domain-containing protein [Anaeromyxobacteraceae bacterium]